MVSMDDAVEREKMRKHRSHSFMGFDTMTNRKSGSKIVRRSHSLRGTSPSPSTKNSSNKSWHVKIPRRMVLMVMAVFLLLPLTFFMWKETHLHHNEHHHEPHKSMVRGHHHEVFPTWMEDAEKKANSDHLLDNEPIEKEDELSTSEKVPMNATKSQSNQTVHNSQLQQQAAKLEDSGAIIPVNSAHNNHTLNKSDLQPVESADSSSQINNKPGVDAIAVAQEQQVHESISQGLTSTVESKTEELLKDAHVADGGKLESESEEKDRQPQPFPDIKDQSDELVGKQSNEVNDAEHVNRRLGNTVEPIFPSQKRLFRYSNSSKQR